MSIQVRCECGSMLEIQHIGKEIIVVKSCIPCKHDAYTKGQVSMQPKPKVEDKKK